MNIEESMITILAYVTINNDRDKDIRVAEAASILQEFLVLKLALEKKQKASAEKTNTIYSTKKRKEAAKKAWRKRLNKKV